MHRHNTGAPKVGRIARTARLVAQVRILRAAAGSPLIDRTHAAKWTSANLGAGGSCTRTKKLAARSAPQRLAGPPARNCGGCNHRRGAPNDRPQDSTSKPIHPSTAASNSLCPPTSAQRNVTNPPTVSLRQKSRGRGASPPRLRAPTCVSPSQLRPQIRRLGLA